MNPPAISTAWDYLAQVNAEAFAGHSDWRLPTTAGTGALPTGEPDELESIVDPAAAGCGTNACIEPTFGPTVAFGYWTSIEEASNDLLAWSVDFSGVNADPLPLAKVGIGFGRAVRTRPATCDDGFRNGNETAVDCGGDVCAACPNGVGCVVDGDCLSDRCDAGTCKDACDGAPIDTPCDDDGNPCTVDFCANDVCTHLPGNSGTVCRPAAGPCDVQETCTGTTSACPDDAKRIGGSQCSVVLEGPCDAPDFCDGVSDACTVETVRPAGFVCGDAAGPCARQPECDGVSTECNDPLTPVVSGIFCRPRDPANDCDVPDRCGLPDPESPFYNPNWPACSPDLRLTSGECDADGAIGECIGEGTLGDPEGQLTAECVAVPCRYDINCPDGRVCGETGCVEQPSGQGAACTGDGGTGSCSPGLLCCASLANDGEGAVAPEGVGGRCAECCTSFGDGDCGGGAQCCDGECVNPLNDTRHCGGCGYDALGAYCDDYRTRCSPTVTSCEFGACQFSNPCPGDTACRLLTDTSDETCNPCDPDDVFFCFAGLVVPNGCFEGPDFTCCDFECVPLDPEGQVSRDCTGDSCEVDGDCCTGFSCIKSCNPLNPFCLDLGVCRLL